MQITARPEPHPESASQKSVNWKLLADYSLLQTGKRALPANLVEGQRRNWKREGEQTRRFAPHTFPVYSLQFTASTLCPHGHGLVYAQILWSHEELESRKLETALFLPNSGSNARDFSFLGLLQSFIFPLFVEVAALERSCELIERPSAPVLCGDGGEGNLACRRGAWVVVEEF